ncbi:MAG TPA: YajG family lipoprotein [Spongiibacteraceae bacterium]|jgi:uncharacterized lipoprotein|nr:YajG family lipoprotein [Spongiibacteraceae bacterium]HUH38235.1 YajG family lipoprotein [Spongiibacteraceae bacterium]
MKLLGVFALTALLGACALSPQQVVLQPTLTYSGERVQSARPVIVSVVDGRDQAVLGTRGGVYGDTSVITLANDLSEALTRALNAGLAAQGYAVNTSNMDDAVRLKVTVEELRYTTPEKGVAAKATVKAGVKADAYFGDSHFEGRYGVSKEKSFVARPGMEDNAELINAAVTEALERMFADPKLRAFLQGSAGL